MGSGAGAAGGGWSRRRFVGTLAGAAAVTVLPAPAPPGSAPDRTAAGPDRARATGERPSAGPSAGPSANRPSPRPAGPRPLYLGTYTSAEGGGKGIGLATYDSDTGRITGTGTLTGVANPSYLALHPDGRTLYAVDEQDDGAVTAVRLSDHTVLGTRGTGGAGPCHVSVHPGGRWLLSANYTSGSVAVHP